MPGRLCPKTQEQFGAWAHGPKLQPRPHMNHCEDRPTHPADSVSRGDADAHCAGLTRTLSTDAACSAGFVATLPTEAKWEYACLAGSGTDNWNGHGEATLAR